MRELENAASSIINAAYLLEEATDSLRTAGKVFREPAGIESICNSLHQASNSLQNASSSLKLLLDEVKSDGIKLDTTTESEFDIKDEPEELSDIDDPGCNDSPDIDPLSQNLNSNEIEMTDTKEITREQKNGNNKENKYEFSCSICPYQTDKKTYLRHHMLRHTDDKFFCSKCDYSTSHKPLLQIHIDSKHKKEKIQCDKCDYQTGHPKYLRHHYKRMHEPNPYKCDQCTFTCVYPSDLKIHVSSKHEGVRFKCDQCSLSYPFKGDLTTHIRSAHQGVRYPCQYCHFTTPHRFNLRNHLMKKHKLSSEEAKHETDNTKSMEFGTAGGVDKPKRGRPIQRVSRRGTRGQGRPAARRGRPPKLKAATDEKCDNVSIEYNPLLQPVPVIMVRNIEEIKDDYLPNTGCSKNDNTRHATGAEYNNQIRIVSHQQESSTMEQAETPTFILELNSEQENLNFHQTNSLLSSSETGPSTLHYTTSL